MNFPFSSSQLASMDEKQELTSRIKAGGLFHSYEIFNNTPAFWYISDDAGAVVGIVPPWSLKTDTISPSETYTLSPQYSLPYNLVTGISSSLYQFGVSMYTGTLPPTIVSLVSTVIGQLTAKIDTSGGPVDISGNVSATFPAAQDVNLAANNAGILDVSATFPSAQDVNLAASGVTLDTNSTVVNAVLKQNPTVYWGEFEQGTMSIAAASNSATIEINSAQDGILLDEIIIAVACGASGTTFNLVMGNVVYWPVGDFYAVSNAGTLTPFLNQSGVLQYYRVPVNPEMIANGFTCALYNTTTTAYDNTITIYAWARYATTNLVSGTNLNWLYEAPWSDTAPGNVIVTTSQDDGCIVNQITLSLENTNTSAELFYLRFAQASNTANYVDLTWILPASSVLNITETFPLGGWNVMNAALTISGFTAVTGINGTVRVFTS